MISVDIQTQQKIWNFETLFLSVLTMMINVLFFLNDVDFFLFFYDVRFFGGFCGDNFLFYDAVELETRSARTQTVMRIWVYD